jgi:hypothetical protein
MCEMSCIEFSLSPLENQVKSRPTRYDVPQHVIFSNPVLLHLSSSPFKNYIWFRIPCETANPSDIWQDPLEGVSVYRKVTQDKRKAIKWGIIHICPDPESDLRFHWEYTCLWARGHFGSSGNDHDIFRITSSCYNIIENSFSKMQLSM